MSKTVITDFLRRCIEYADASISRKIDRGDDSDIIAEWKAYRNYTQYSLEEIEKGDLDHWLTRDISKAEMEIDNAYSYASSVIVENLLYKETNRGMNDFLNKKS